MVALRHSVSGASLLNSVLGAGAGGNETLSMKQVSPGLLWLRTF